jgi:hypothetical protein
MALLALMTFFPLESRPAAITGIVSRRGALANADYYGRQASGLPIGLSDFAIVRHRL